MFDSNHRDHTEQMYQDAADKVFTTLLPSCPLLTAVIFMMRFNTNSLTWSFVWSKQDARAKPLGANVAPHVIKAHKPGSDMLEPERMIFD